METQSVKVFLLIGGAQISHGVSQAPSAIHLVYALAWARDLLASMGGKRINLSPVITSLQDHISPFVIKTLSRVQSILAAFSPGGLGFDCVPVFQSSSHLPRAPSANVSHQYLSALVAAFSLDRLFCGH